MSMPAARRRLVFASLIHERDPQVRVTEPPEAAAGVAAAILEGRRQPRGLLLQEARERRERKTGGAPC